MPLPNAWKEWFVPMFDFVERHDVKALCYIDCDWNQIPMFSNMGWGNSTIQAEPTLLSEWKNKVSGQRYLRAGKELFSAIGYHPSGHNGSK